MRYTKFSNIRYLVTCDDKDNVFEHVDMLVRDNEIVYIGASGARVEDDEIREHLERPDEVLDASKLAVYPGLINTHHHLYQIFTRNLPATQNMELFPWLKYLYQIWKKLDCEVIRYTSLTGIGELMKNGCTTVFDHHYVFPEDVMSGKNRAGMRDTDPNYGLIDAQADAAADIGVRMHFSRGSMSLSEKDGGLPPDSVVQETAAIIKDSERLIAKYNDMSRFSMKRLALAPCSPFSVSEDLLVESAALARQYGARLHTHLCETKDEENYMLERYGMRPLAYMEKVGWIGKDVWYAHGIHFNDEELRLLAATGTGVAHCPISNMKLSSGIARIPEMLEMGIPVGLAVDGSASNDGSNLLEEMRVAFLLHRLNSSQKAPTGYDILKVATRGSAKILGRDDIGCIEVGKAADLFAINTERIELVGAMDDPKAVFATVGLKSSVDYTMVNGKFTVREGRLTTIDEEKLYADSQMKWKQFIS